MILLDTGVITYGNNQKFCFVVAVDHFTWWIEVRVLGKKTSEEIIQLLRILLSSGMDFLPGYRWTAVGHMCLTQYFGFARALVCSI